MKARVRRMIAKGFAKFSKSFAQAISDLPLLENRIKIPMMESNKERTRGKIPGPGWVILPIGSVSEREKKQIPTIRKNIPPARSLSITCSNLFKATHAVKAKAAVFAVA